MRSALIGEESTPIHTPTDVAEAIHWGLTHAPVLNQAQIDAIGNLVGIKPPAPENSDNPPVQISK